MVSVAELLNPEPPRAPLPTSRPPSIPRAPRTVAFRNELAPAGHSVETVSMVESAVRNPSRCKVKGVVNFPPYEDLDETSLREVRRFQVYPLGSIQENPERILYKSDKKDFFAKTGREGFEVFHYDFKVPGDDTVYTVMWDYSVGLVRMTPFFKCRGYSKTTPAKMLNQNPGLKDITHSITGGSIKAQGYWMPFSCAKAVCATFCYKIAGALIPLFGPQFPYECIPEKVAGYDRMIISPEIVARAKADAAALFRPAALPSPRPSRSASPSTRCTGRAAEACDRHSGHDPRLLLSPYTDTDPEYHPASEPPTRRAFPAMTPLPISTRPGVPTPTHSPGWTAVNTPHAAYHRRAVSHLNEEPLSMNLPSTAHPWLSAVPRSSPPAAAGASRLQPYYPRLPPYHHQTSPLSTSFADPAPIILPPLRIKRPFDQVEHRPCADKGRSEHGDPQEAKGEEDYDAGESHAGSPSGSATSSNSNSPVRVVHAPLPLAGEGDRGLTSRRDCVFHDNQADAEDADSNSAVFIKAPPPSPTGGPSIVKPKFWCKSRSSTPTPPSPAPHHAGAGAASKRDERAAAEREAAIMLMHMMRGKPAESGRARPEMERAYQQRQQERSRHGHYQDVADEEEQKRREKKKKKNNDRDKARDGGAIHVGGYGNGRFGTATPTTAKIDDGLYASNDDDGSVRVAGKPAAHDPSSAMAATVSRPAATPATPATAATAMLEESDGGPAAAVGPVTRSKRRRTAER